MKQPHHGQSSKEVIKAAFIVAKAQGHKHLISLSVTVSKVRCIIGLN